MPIITANGQIGSGGLDVIHAESLSMDYIDRYWLKPQKESVPQSRQLNKKIHNLGLLDRIVYFIKVMLETPSVGSTTGEPYYAPGVEYTLSKKYTDINLDPITEA